MNKKLIRLTESDLHRIVKESVNRMLMENYNSNGKSFPIDPSDLARQLYNSGCDFYMFVHRLEKTYEMIKDENNEDFQNIGKISDNTFFDISIDDKITPQELDVLAKISYKYPQNIEYDGDTHFYVYDTAALSNFIKDIKSLGLGKLAYVYKREESEDYVPELIEKITI